MFLLFWLHPVLSLITVKSHLVISGWSITGYKKSPWGAQSSELMDSPSFFFFFIIIQYTPPCSATSAASIKDIKATGYIFIISNHIVFTALCLWGGSWKWKYLHESSTPAYREKKKEKKKKEETKRENKLWASNHGGLSSPSISCFDEEEGCFLMFFLFNFSFLSPSPSWLGPPSAAERRRGVAGV